MAYTVTNRKVNLQGVLNVVFGDITLGSAAELVTGLKHVQFFSLSSASATGQTIIFNSDDGTVNTKQGSMYIGGGAGAAKFMAIGV